MYSSRGCGCNNCIDVLIITRESQTHDVDVCGAGKAYNMVAKGSAIINSEMQSGINAQRRYCAGPRLDRARDVSLEH